MLLVVFLVGEGPLQLLAAHYHSILLFKLIVRRANLQFVNKAPQL